MQRVLNEPAAILLYAWLDARYANRAGVAWPKRDRLAADLHCSVKTIERAIDTLRRAGALTSTQRRQPGTGFVVGNDYELIRVEPSRAASAAARRPRKGRPVRTRPLTAATTLHVPGDAQAPAPAASLSVPGVVQGLSDSGDVQGQSLSDPGDAAFLIRNQIHVDLVAVVASGSSDRARIHAREALPTSSAERQQQQDEGKGIVHDDDQGIAEGDGPTTADCLRAFYAGWAQQHDGLPYDERPSDVAKMDNIRWKLADFKVDFDVLDVIEAYLAWPDPFCRSRGWPIGLLEKNLAKVITWRDERTRAGPNGRRRTSASGLQLECPHTPRCASTWACGQLQLMQRAAGGDRRRWQEH